MPFADYLCKILFIIINFRKIRDDTESVEIHYD